MLKLAASFVECVSSRWSAHNFADGASMVDNDVSNVLMTVFRKVIDATRRKVPIMELEMKDASMRVLTQNEIESQAAILRFRAELERNDSEAI